MVSREYKEIEPSLLLGCERFGDVDERTSTAQDASSTAPLAHAVGPPLLSESDGGAVEHATLVGALYFAARNHGDRGITYASASCESIHESYSELLTQATRLLSALARAQIDLPRVEPIVLQLVETRVHIRALWACVLGGQASLTVAVAPKITPSNAVAAKLLAAVAKLRVRYVLSSDAIVAPLRALMPDAVHVVGMGSLDVAGAPCAPVPLEALCGGTAAPIQPSDVLFYQLTSGSTGVPKVIPETHAAVISHIRATAQGCGVCPSDEVSLNWLPFDHVVPLLTCHFTDVYLGRAAVQLPTDDVIADPLLWLRTMAFHRVTHSWAPNFGYKLIVAALRAIHGTAGSSASPGSMTTTTVGGSGGKGSGNGGGGGGGSSDGSRGGSGSGGGTPAIGNLTFIRRLMNAGEQVTAEVCDAFLSLTGLPPDVMQPAFGMAETATCMTYQNSYSPQLAGRSSVLRVLASSLGEPSCRLATASDSAKVASAFVCLGPPAPGVEIRIAVHAERPDEPAYDCGTAALGAGGTTLVGERAGTDPGTQTSSTLRELQIGRLQIRGACVMGGYVDHPVANAQCLQPDGWLDSGDLGFLVAPLSPSSPRGPAPTACMCS